MKQNDILDTLVRGKFYGVPEGSVSDRVLQFIASSVREGDLKRSIETGCGRTTPLLAALSGHHTVFCLEDSRNLEAVNRYLTNDEHTHWVFGPTQVTLRTFDFVEPIDFALLDGPHAYPFPDLEYFFVYPHLNESAWLVIDDVQIPTINNLMRFLKSEPMFNFIEQVDNTAFFRRTDAPLFDPYGDGWEQQKYNIQNLYRLKPFRVRAQIFMRKLMRLHN